MLQLSCYSTLCQRYLSQQLMLRLLPRLQLHLTQLQYVQRLLFLLQILE